MLQSYKLAAQHTAKLHHNYSAATNNFTECICWLSSATNHWQSKRL